MKKSDLLHEIEQEHVIMQLRKNVLMGGVKTLKFEDGSQVRLSQEESEAILQRYNNLRPLEKEEFQHWLGESVRNALRWFVWPEIIVQSEVFVREEEAMPRTIKKPIHLRPK